MRNGADEAWRQRCRAAKKLQWLNLRCAALKASGRRSGWNESAMKTILMRLGIVVACVGVFALVAWGTRMVLRPVRAFIYYNRGFNEYKAGNYDAAITEYNRALEIDPEEYQSYFGRARVKEALYDLPGALADYDRCIELKPKMAIAFGGRSRVKALLGDMAGATADAGQMMALQPDDHAFFQRGWLKRINDDPAGARTDFDRAIQINPGSSASYSNRGCLEYLDHQWDDALKDLRHSCGVASEDRVYPHLYIWLTRTRQGQLKAASEELAVYLDGRKPGKPGTKGDWAPKLAKFLLGQVTEDELFATAKAADPKELNRQLCEAWYYAGEKRWLAGDRESAAQDFRKCLQTERKDFEEYAFAKAELKALGRE
jgi:lipoprotein NlpI